VKDFLAASVGQRDDQRRKEMALEWARKKMLAIAVFAMVFMGTTFTAHKQWRKAEKAQRELTAQQAKTQSSLADQYWFHAADEFQGFQADDKAEGHEKSDVYKGLMWLAEAYDKLATSETDQLQPEIQRLYEVRAGAILSQHPMPNRVAWFSGKRPVAISRDERFVIVISESDSAGLEIHALSEESQGPLHELSTDWPVRSAVFSPDGNYMLAIGSSSGDSQLQEKQNQLMIWSCPEGDKKDPPQEISNASLVSEGFVKSAEFLVDSNGGIGLIATILESNGVSGVWVWDSLNAPGRRLVIEERSPENTGPQKPEPADLLFAAQFTMSPDGRFAVVQDSYARNVSLLDVQSHRLIPLPSLQNMTTSVTAFSEDGKWLAIAGEAGGVFIFSTSHVTAGKFTEVVNAKWLFGITKIAFGPDRQVVTVSNNMASLWTFKAPQEEGPEQQRPGASSPPSGSPNLQWRSGEIYLNGEVQAVKFNRDGRLLAFGCRDRLMRVVDVQSGRLALPPLHHPLGISEVSFSADGRFVTGRTGYTVQRWNLAARNAPTKIVSRDLAKDAVTSSTNHRFMATIERNPDAAEGGSQSDYVVSVIDLAGKREKCSQSVDGSLWRCVSVSDDGRAVLVTETDNSRFQLVQFANGDPGRVINLSGMTADSVVGTESDPSVKPSTAPVVGDARAAFSPDTQFLLIASGAASTGSLKLDAVSPWKLQLWDVHTAKPMLEIPVAIELGAVNQVAWSPTNDSFVLAVGGNRSGSGQLWRLGADHKPKLFLHLKHPNEQPENLKIVSTAFSSDGQYVVTGGVGDKAYVWRSSDGERIGGPLQHDSDVVLVQFSADPNAKLLLATGGTADKKVNIWKIENADGSSSQINVDSICTVNPQGGVESLMFSPDNEFVATVSGSDVWIWSLYQGKLAAVLKHPSSVKAVRFSDDSRSLRTIRLNAGTAMEFRGDRYIDVPRGILAFESEWQLRSSLTDAGPRQLREIGQLLAASELNLQDRGLIRLTKIDESFNDTPDSATARNLDKLWTKYGRGLRESLPPSFEGDAIAADRFESTGEWFAALWHYQKAINDSSTDNPKHSAELHAGLGRVYTQRKEFEKAKTAWDAAVEKDQKWQAAADRFHIAQARDAATQFEAQKD